MIASHCTSRSLVSRDVLVLRMYASGPCTTELQGRNGAEAVHNEHRFVARLLFAGNLPSRLHGPTEQLTLYYCCTWR